MWPQRLARGYTEEGFGVQEIAQGLPSVSFARLPSTGETIIIKRGELGYYPSQSHRAPEELNADLEVTPAQAEAMLVGSMFGWDVPGADPANYDEHGRFRASAPDEP